ncbi:tyrosine-type recombinase/integrase [Legionella pneumophila serogroup 2]|nr:tyrosine-type recombinase/integrase [Legionella pneumophila]
MSNHVNDIEFYSPIASLILQFIQEKRACGRQYKEAPRILKGLDEFLCQSTLKEIDLPEDLVLRWLKKSPKEQASTHQRRIGLVRQLASMMVRFGYPAFIVPVRFGTPRDSRFIPHIFTREEIGKIIYAADQIKPTAKTPWRHLVLPEIYRLLYGCGFRLQEVLNLRVEDVDLSRGVIMIRKAKYEKDRLVPPALDMVERLQVYSEEIANVLLEKQTNESFFFPSSIQKAWSGSDIYSQFRKLLFQCGIPHSGRGKGPRVHDLRHTFAVHRLIQWYEEGADLNAKLPLLVAYLGHQDFTGTQKYLHLTAELFPNLIERMNKQFGGVIPRGR